MPNEGWLRALVPDTYEADAELRRWEGVLGEMTNALGGPCTGRYGVDAATGRSPLKGSVSLSSRPLSGPASSRQTLVDRRQEAVHRSTFNRDVHRMQKQLRSDGRRRDACRARPDQASIFSISRRTRRRTLAAGEPPIDVTTWE